MKIAKETVTAVKQVLATGIASSSNISGDTARAAEVEAAMQHALRKCLDEGVTDPEQQRERVLAARDAALNP